MFRRVTGENCLGESLEIIFRGSLGIAVVTGDNYLGVPQGIIVYEAYDDMLLELIKGIAVFSDAIFFDTDPAW